MKDLSLQEPSNKQPWIIEDTLSRNSFVGSISREAEDVQLICSNSPPRFYFCHSLSESMCSSQIIQQWPFHISTQIVLYSSASRTIQFGKSHQAQTNSLFIVIL